MTSLVYDLDGEFIGVADNPYNITDFKYPEKYEKEPVIYLGKVGSEYLFHYRNADTRKINLYLLNKEGDVKIKTEIADSTFGKNFYGSVSQYWSLRNGNIGVLGEKDGKAFVTILPVEYLFEDLK